MSSRKKALEAVRQVEAELAKLRTAIEGCVRRGEPISAEADLALEDLENQLAEMAKPPTIQ